MEKLTLKKGEKVMFISSNVGSFVLKSKNLRLFDGSFALINKPKNICIVQDNKLKIVDDERIILSNMFYATEDTLKKDINCEGLIRLSKI